MCGITGFWYFDRSRQAEPALLRCMADSIAHRGPDEDGYHVAGNVALGFRRLAIIDVAGSQQPMHNEDDRLWLVFNGEIYNFQELRPALLQAGHRFHTSGDTEVIVHSFEQYGPACLDQFRGMFSLALWDAQQQQMTLAVDPFGKKPLYYALDGDKLIFGSELKAILQHPEVSRDLDLEALDDYLAYGAIRAPATIFKAVRKLPPGSWLTVDSAGHGTVQHYWQPTFAAPDALDRRPLPELAAALRQRLELAVQRRLISEVPLGAFLSGGVDSSAVVALMARVSSTPVKTFTIAFEESQFNEASYARRLAEHCHTEHHETLVRPDAEFVFSTLVEHLDEPLADASFVPTYYVCREARRHITVALSGDGGDEVFGGYNTYRYAYLSQTYQRMVPDPLHRTALKLLEAAPKNGTVTKLRRRVHLLGLGPDALHSAPSLFDATQRSRLVRPEARGTLLAEQARRAATRAADGADLLTRMQYADLVSYMPADILVKVDRASMFNSLEVRSPLLDRDVFEFMASVPPAYRFDGQRTKILLKEAVKDLLPADWLERKKMGFGVPLGSWLRDSMWPVLQETILSESFKARGLFEAGFVQQIADEHLTGQVDHTNRLWGLLCFELWARRYVDAVPSRVV